MNRVLYEGARTDLDKSLCRPFVCGLQLRQMAPQKCDGRVGSSALACVSVSHEGLTNGACGTMLDLLSRQPSDPQAEYLPTHHNLPALSAIAVHMGDMGELVDRLFLDDYRQYAPPFVDRQVIRAGSRSHARAHLPLECLEAEAGQTQDASSQARCAERRSPLSPARGLVPHCIGQSAYRCQLLTIR